MKKRLVTLLIASVLVLSSCGNSSQTPSSNTASRESESVNQEEQSTEDAMAENNESSKAIDDSEITKEPEGIITAEPSEEMAEDPLGFNVVFSDTYRNDVTGKWRLARIAENINIEEYALDYYNNYFKSDDEVHIIINFTLNSTTRINVLGNVLDVSIMEYVDKEYLDAKIACSGALINEYHVNIDTGAIENVLTTDSTSDTTTLSSDDFVSEISLAIAGDINSKEESIDSISLENGDLHICVTLSDPSPLTYEDLMISRTSSITDSILEFTNCLDLWETITIDFGEHGYIQNGHDNIQGSEGSYYFSSKNFVIQNY